MITRRSFLIAVPLLGTLGCRPRLHGPAWLRVGHFVAGAALDLRLVGPGGEHPLEARLAYAQGPREVEVAPGRWTLVVEHEGVELLRQGFRVGPGSLYSLLVVGQTRLSASAERPGPLDQAVELLAAGSERPVTRALWPRLVLLKDNLDRPSDRAHLRFVHAAPGTCPVRIDVIAPEPRGLVDRLRYGQPAPIESVDPGQVTLEICQEDSAVGGLRERFFAGAGMLYTLVLAGSPFAGRPVAIHRLQNPAALVAAHRA